MIFLDPINLLLMVFGYFLMFILASFIAPRVASKFGSRLTLFSSMLILSLLIIFSFSFLIFLIFQLFSEVYFETFIFIISFVILMNLITYIFSPLIIKLIYRVEENEEMQKVVDEVKDKLKYKKRLIGGVAHLNFPNAFAFGNFIFGKYVVVTEGLLKIVDKNELKAVIGHEIGHHLHKDNAIMLIFGLLPSIIYYLGYALLTLRDEERKNLMNIGIGIFAIVFSFILQILILAFSRLREYFADYEGAKATNKEIMQSSLVKIHEFYQKNKINIESEQNIGKTLFIYAFLDAIANPLVSRETIEKIKRKKASPLEEFLSSHPPISKRLKFLDSIKL
jgi:heat shock protein HtpX